TKLDVRTGHVTAFKLTAPDGTMLANGRMSQDPKGNIWFTTGRYLTRLLAGTDAFTSFAAPPNLGRIYNSSDADSQGRAWSNGMYGSARLDPTTRRWQMYQQSTPGDGQTYGMAADVDDNGWWSEATGDRVVKADVKTGITRELLMRDPTYDERKKLATTA